MNRNEYYTPRKVVIGKHWRRPKPKVYDCNVRDVERFYQESYKDYLEAKDSARQRASASVDRERHIDEIAGKFRPEYRRTAGTSYLDELRDRDNSDVTSGARQYSRQYSAQSNDSAGGERSNLSSYRASSVTNDREFNGEADIDNINDRLSRLRKLREELGLPSTTDTKTDNSSSFTSSVTKSSNVRQASPVIERRGRSSRVTEESTSSRQLGSRSRATDSSADRLGGDRYTNKSESKYSYTNSDDPYGKTDNSYSSSYSKKFSALKSGNTDDTDDSYSSKKTRSKVRFGEDDDYKYSSSTSKKSNRSESKVGDSASSFNGKLDMDDDDEMLKNIRKKFPSSDEIMERIKKLDVDV